MTVLNTRRFAGSLKIIQNNNNNNNRFCAFGYFGEMVRHCAVRGCNNTDMSTLCHRFPKRKDAFEQWQRSLQLDDTEANLLMQRFVVCTLHFKTSDYRNSASRMLNTVAVPTLSIHNKDAFYDAPTSTFGGSANDNSTRNCSSNVNTLFREICSHTDSTKSNEPANILLDSTLIIERVESPASMVEEIESEEDMIYFLEEEAIPMESVVTDLCEDARLQISAPIEPPKAKRFKLEASEIKQEKFTEHSSTPEEVNITLQTSPECRNSSVQTDDIEILPSEDKLHRQMIDECYPEYAGYSRLDLVKQLKQKDERLAELTKKLANFETAHAAMIKTMETFKTLVN